MTTATSPLEYGIAPPGYRLPNETRIGRVVLQIAELERSLAYYQAVVGLRIVARDGERAVLGAHGDDRPLVRAV